MFGIFEDDEDAFVFKDDFYRVNDVRVRQFGAKCHLSNRGLRYSGVLYLTFLVGFEPMQILAKLLSYTDPTFSRDGAISARGGEASGAEDIGERSSTYLRLPDSVMNIQSKVGLKEGLWRQSKFDEAEGEGLLLDGKFFDLSISALSFVNTTIGATANETNDLVATIDTLLVVVAARGHVAL